MTDLYYKISSGGDDAHENSSGTLSTTASLPTLDTGEYQCFRFTGVAIPQGATINEAWFQFWTNDNGQTVIDFAAELYASDEDNSSAPSGSNFISNLTPTTAKNTLPSDQMNFFGWLQSNATDIIQEIVNRGSWVSGNALTMVLKSTGTPTNEPYIRHYDGLASRAAQLRVKYGETVVDLELQIEDDDDEATQTSGGSLIQANDYYLYYAPGVNHAAFRFTNVTIPQYATIDSAYLIISPFETSEDSTDHFIRAEDVGNATALPASDTGYLISHRTAKTPQYVAWATANILSNNDEPLWVWSPDIKTVIQAVVNREDWASGNALKIVLEYDNNSVNFVTRSHEYWPDMGYRLHVNYTVGSAPTSLTVRRWLSQGSDDAVDFNPTMEVTSSWQVYYGQSNDLIGVRFQNIPIPQGANVTSAYLYIIPNTSDTYNDPDVHIHAEDIDNAPTFVATDNNIQNRTKTTAYTAWNASNIASTPSTRFHVKSPDIASVIQEVVDRGGWSSGNALAIILAPQSGTSLLGFRSYESYNGPGYAAMLEITYDAAYPRPEASMTVGMACGVYTGLTV